VKEKKIAPCTPFPCPFLNFAQSPFLSLDADLIETPNSSLQGTAHSSTSGYTQSLLLVKEMFYFEIIRTYQK
jgi:hypothetical protein